MSARAGDSGPITWPGTDDLVEPNNLGRLIGGLFNPGGPRTFQKVRRNSPHAGEREERLWRQFNMFSTDDHAAIMSAAEQIEKETKKKGRRNGKIGYIGLAVYRYLLRLRAKVQGRLYPSLDCIAKEVGHCRSAVHAALVRLKLVGLLNWLRRSVPVENPEPGGQYNKQTSNAFIFDISEKMQKRIAAIRRRLTPKAAAAAKEADRAARSAAMTIEQNLDALTCPSMRATLERMDATLRGENLHDSLNNPLKI